MTTHAPITFIHFTDTHIQAEFAEPLMKMDTFHKWQDSIQLVRELGITPAFFVVSGDLCHESDVAGYARFKTIVDDLTSSFGVPVLLALGNHDLRIPFRQVLLNQTESDEHKPYYYSQVIGDVRVIVLDSKIPDEVGGMIDADQMRWLIAELQTPAPAAGNLIVLHHPPMLNNANDAAGHTLANTAELMQALAGQPIVGILSGHIHFHNIHLLNGIQSVTSAGTGYLLRPRMDEELRFLDGAGFSLMQIEDGILTASPLTLPGPQIEVARMKMADILAYMAHEKAAKQASH